MIVFASAVTAPDSFEKYAQAGIARAAEPDSRTIADPARGSIFASYNAILEEAAEIEGLEALVLLHQDAEIEDGDFCAKLRTALADPSVGVVGCVGAIGVRSIAWWEGSVTWASFTHRATELGGGDFPSMTWGEDDHPPYAQLGDVDTVDGFVMGLSPWVVRNIRFDESLPGGLHGYDFDFCLQVREAGRRIVTADLKVIHNHSLELASDLDGWSAGYIAVADKWEGRMPGVGSAGGTFKQRARRAEAEAGATRAVALSTEMKRDARAVAQRRDMTEMIQSIGWRMTAPLRRASEVGKRRGDNEHGG
ncbi:MAG: glycosyltransferase [Solirubrobacteraceae bacterium]